MSKKLNETTQRIPTLDGLRAVSIILVVVNHIFIGQGYADKFYLTGNLGVRIFFVISGFLITRLLVNKINKTARVNLKQFYLRRILRIFPGYYCYLVVIYFLTDINHLQFTQEFLPAVFYSTNYFIVPTQPYFSHTWSLAVEEQFYLIFPIVLRMTNLKIFRKFVVAILIITPFIRYFSADPDAAFGTYEFLKTAWNFHTNMDIIASGCLLALYEKNFHANRFYKRFLQSPFLFSLSVATIVCLGYFADYNLALFYIVGVTLMNFLIMLSMDWLTVNHQSVLGKMLNLRPLCFIGVLSYSIYLWQQPFAFYKEDLIWTHFPLNLFCVFIVSLISYYLVEKTFLNYRKNFEKRDFLKETPGAVYQA